ncbi:uncharacterized protein LOC123321885 [Coccinella septempunctata]|uniref:uncharacterized protein LOC123321885 n=1 Tax=Coccinella septempunctata TaxID=41139 RepID=UPI001D0606DD|nr:uncharacterized protein LOC123321885 [Coccinella septempunctata]
MAYICEAQKKIVIQFLNDHQELKTGKFTKDFTYQKAQALWEQVTNLLNCVPNGAVKPWSKWRKTWQDMKKNAKAKNASIKRYSAGTGGGPAPKELSEVDSDIVSMLSSNQLNGLEVEETEVEFSFLSSQPENEYGEKNCFSLKLDAAVKDIYVDENENMFEKNLVDSEYATPHSSPMKIADSVNLEHDYVGKSTPKRLSKSKRLQTSLEISKNSLNAVTQRNEILEKYYKQKTYMHLRNLKAQRRIDRMNTSWWKYLSMNH